MTKSFSVSHHFSHKQVVLFADNSTWSHLCCVCIHVNLYIIVSLSSCRQVEHRIKLYQQAGAATDTLAGVNSLKRRWHKRVKLRNVEKKLFLPVKNDSSDKEDVEDSNSDDMSVNEEAVNPGSIGEDSNNDNLEDVVLSVTSETTSSNEGKSTEAVYSTVGKPAPSSNHSLVHQRTSQGDVKNETAFATVNGQGFNQQIGNALDQHVPTYYVTVDRLPEIQVCVLV